MIRTVLDTSIVHVPKVCVVETAAVAKRLAGRTLAARASKGILKSYNVADEDAIFYCRLGCGIRDRLFRF